MGNGRITRASKTLIAVKQRRVIECSLVNKKNDAWKPGLRPVEALRACSAWIHGSRGGESAGSNPGDVQFFCSQASDSMWRMPGHTEAMKAVVSCDKPGGAAHTH